MYSRLALAIRPEMFLLAFREPHPPLSVALSPPADPAPPISPSAVRRSSRAMIWSLPFVFRPDGGGRLVGGVEAGRDDARKRKHCAARYLFSTARWPCSIT